MIILRANTSTVKRVLRQSYNFKFIRSVSPINLKHSFHLTTAAKPLSIRNYSDTPYIPHKSYQGEWRSKVKNLRRRISAEQSDTRRKTTLEGSQKVVALAITSNAIMFSGKLYGAIMSGSASMYAESLHSLADIYDERVLADVW
jgi:hypothetical protein